MSEEYLYKEVRLAYEKRKSSVNQELVSYVETLENHHRLFGQYVIANIADSDLDVAADIYIDYIDHAIFLYDDFEHEDYPMETFLNYVLNVRVTKEKLDVCRKIFFNEVKDLVDHTDLVQSIININHWSGSEVKYRSTDARTKSALHTFRTGGGRCGEKAAFLVHVFRSVGIPSRQVFSPWWTHSDDNHAWVDVYVNGAWHYIGDGSGEELLDKAWFTLPATRSPLIATSVFSNVVTLDDVVDDSAGNYKVLNIVERFGNVKPLTIYNEIEGLMSIEVAVINFGSFRKVVELEFVNNKAEIRLGSGDVFLRSYYKGDLILKAVPATVDTVTLTGDDIIVDHFEFSQTPGAVDRIPEFDETEVQKERKKRKKAESQALYEKKIASLSEAGLNHEEYAKLIDLAGQECADDLMSVISEKDQEDFKAEVLYDHYLIMKEAKNDFVTDIYRKYLLNPRILWEEISGYASVYHEKFKDNDDFKENPKEIYKYVINSLDMNSKYRINNTFMPVDKMLDLGVGSSVDAKILTVAIARSLHIPARYNKNLDEAEYFDGQRFIGFEEKNERFCLTLDGAIDHMEVSIQTKEKQDQTNINYIDKDSFKVTEDGPVFVESLEAAAYEVIATKRLPSGKIVGTLDLVDLKKDSSLTIINQNVKVEDMIEDIKVDDLLSQSVHDYGNIGLLVIGDAYEEPTAHVMNEIIKQQEILNELNVTVYFHALDQSEDADLLKKTESVINNFSYLNDVNKDLEEQLIRRVFKQPKDYPFVLLFKNGRALFSNTGYHVGTIDNPWIEPALKL